MGDRLIPKKRPVKYIPQEEEQQPPPEEDDRINNDDDLDEEEEDEDFSDEESFDSDDEDDEDDEDGDGDGPEADERRRPKKKRKRNMFIEEEAEVDEDDEDEEYGDDDDMEDDFVNEAEDAVKLQPQIYRELDQRRDREQFGNAEEMAREIEERYSRARPYRDSIAGFAGDSASLPMQFLLPSNKDPNLWLVRCKPGRERDIAMNLMRKYQEYIDSDHPLRIKSVITRDTLKGYIYIEARSMADVQTALDKMNNVYISKITLVPLEEMVDVMTIKKREGELKEGGWVRIARGKYKGDLAQVLLAENPDRVEIRYIPRMDTTPRVAGQGKRKSAVRPPQKLFYPKDVPEGDTKSFSKSGSFWVWGSDRFDAAGFLNKEVNIRSLITENVTPTLEEISKFSVDADSGPLDIAKLEITKESKEQQFALGDTVIVNEGDLQNATGTVKFIDKTHVVIQSRDSGLGDIEIEASKLSRLFQVGDHVKVIRGKFQDETGMITQVEGNIVTVFSDATMAQFQVFAKDVRTAAEVSVTENQGASYAVQDLVQLGVSGVGVIVKVERDQYKVMDQSGAVQTVKPAEITQKRDSKKAVALDANQFTLHSGDVVEVLVGEHQNKQATILHVYRTWAFLHNKDIIENGGIFVVRTKMIRIASAVKTGGAFGGPAGYAPQAQGAFKAPAPQIASKRRELLHQTVYITKGSFKGYQGFVKDVSEKGARVQLNTNGKVITIDPSNLRTGNTRGGAQTDGGYDRSRYAGAATPAFGSRTPAAWSGAQTPSHHEGAKTPAWDAGARTPAWDAGSKTPANFATSSDIGALDNGWGSQPSPYVSTPANNFGSTPYAPGTPAAPTPFGGTSSSGWESNEPKAPVREFGEEWLMVGIEVRFLKGQFNNKIGHVVEVSDNGKTGQVVIDNTKVMISAEHLEPIPPEKKGACIFITGDFKGTRGTLIGAEGNDAIVKMEAASDFKIVSMSHVCKLHE